jgi:antitoxin component of MazEF toxin-antitoxin module
MDQKILKTGNSLAITIPAQFAKTLGLRPGQPVAVKVDLATGRLTITFHNSGQLSLLPKKS